MQDESIYKTGVGGYHVNNIFKIVKMNNKNNKREENKENQQINSTNKKKTHCTNPKQITTMLNHVITAYEVI